MYEPHNLTWLNLSYNYLVKIDEEILHFPNLKSLNLQGNYIKSLEEVRKLNNLSEIYALALNGNPIEGIKGYRMIVLGLMYSKYATLKKLDSVIVTKAEFDSHVIWNEIVHSADQNRLKRMLPPEPVKEVPKLEEENANK